MATKTISATLSVGDASCDIQGTTQAHVQSAVDRVAALGGGEVRISAGVFLMDDALHLRSGVTVRGAGEATVLRKGAMRRAAVTTILGFGHNDLVVDTPDVFKVGDGVVVSSRKTFGFFDTTGTLIRREGDTWFINRTHNADYDATAGAVVRTLHPLVDAVDIADAVLEDVLLEGNAAENERLNGCRGGAFYAYRSQRIVARRVTVRDFCGDGFSFQTCDDLELDGCQAEGCHGHGFHPGSGSNRFHIHGCAARHCQDCGLFYCLRVRDGVLEDSVFEENRSHGIYIWARDERHLNRRLVIRRNGGCGICFRDIPPHQGSNDHTFDTCVLEQNCATDGTAEILLQGHARGTCLNDVRITRRNGIPGILVAPGMPPFENRDTVITPAGPDAVVYQ